LEKSVRFENVSKKFGESVALSNVSFAIEQGDFFTILGPSGCGKTTLLRLLAGFDTPDSGKVFLDGKEITSLPPNKRPVNTVFQNYALFPHLDIWENIAFGLRVSGKKETEIRKEVAAMLELIQMGEHAHKMPGQISGGQKQRVAIARALINHPKVLLLDEPLAALDLKLRQKMLLELDLIHDEVGITFIFITHDQTEAMSVSDHIAILNQGTVEQIGTPIEIYEAPVNSFVAGFVGDTNLLDGQVAKSSGSEYSALSFPYLPPVVCFNDKRVSIGEWVQLSVRPEKVRISRDAPSSSPLMNVMRGVVDDVVYKGGQTFFGVMVQEYKFHVIQQHSHFYLDERPIEWKDNVWISWHADEGYLLEKK